MELLPTLANWALVGGVPALLLYQYRISERMSRNMGEVRDKLGAFVSRDEVEKKVSELRREVREDFAKQEHRLDLKFIEHRNWSEVQFSGIKDLLIRLDDRTRIK